jgi:hypothetical protein
MYSPGTLKAAVAVVLPPSAPLTGGRGLSKVTGPAPRNMLQVTLTGGTRGGPAAAGAGTVRSAVATLSFGGSSVTQAVNLAGSGSVVVSVAAIPDGGPLNEGPAGWNVMTGGVFCEATSSNGSSTQSRCVCSVMILV